LKLVVVKIVDPLIFFSEQMSKFCLSGTFKLKTIAYISISSQNLFQVNFL